MGSNQQLSFWLSPPLQDGADGVGGGDGVNRAMMVAVVDDAAVVVVVVLNVSLLSSPNPVC